MTVKGKQARAGLVVAEHLAKDNLVFMEGEGLVYRVTKPDEEFVEYVKLFRGYLKRKGIGTRNTDFFPVRLRYSYLTPGWEDHERNRGCWRIVRRNWETNIPRMRGATHGVLWTPPEVVYA